MIASVLSACLEPAFGLPPRPEERIGERRASFWRAPSRSSACVSAPKSASRASDRLSAHVERALGVPRADSQRASASRRTRRRASSPRSAGLSVPKNESACVTRALGVPRGDLRPASALRGAHRWASSCLSAYVEPALGERRVSVPRPRGGLLPASALRGAHLRASSCLSTASSWPSACVERAMELSLAVGRTSDLSSRSEERGREPPPAHRRARFEPSADHDSPTSRLTRSW